MSIPKIYIFFALLVGGFLFWITRKGAAASVGLAVSQAAVDMTTGVVEGAATIVGVPLTNEEKCKAAIARRDSLDASLYCDLGTFLKYEKDMIFGSDVKQSLTPSNAQPATLQ